MELDSPSIVVEDDVCGASEFQHFNFNSRLLEDLSEESFFLALANFYGATRYAPKSSCRFLVTFNQ
jgi:hypothetical protein